MSLGSAMVLSLIVLSVEKLEKLLPVQIRVTDEPRKGPRRKFPVVWDGQVILLTRFPEDGVIAHALNNPSGSFKRSYCLLSRDRR